MFHRYRARRPVLAEVDFEPLVRAAATLRAEREETDRFGFGPTRRNTILRDLLGNYCKTRMCGLNVSALFWTFQPRGSEAFSKEKGEMLEVSRSALVGFRESRRRKHSGRVWLRASTAPGCG
jgi:hypothetical protein